MGLYCIESLGKRIKEQEKSVQTQKYSDGNAYDANAFAYIESLVENVDTIEGDSPVIILQTKKDTEETDFSDSIVFFVSIGLLNIIGQEQYAVNMQKFEELSTLYKENEDKIKGASKKIGTIK